MTGSSVAAPRFDWYAATINVATDTLRDVLCRDLLGTAVPEARGMNGYHASETIRDREGKVLATLLHGGNGDIPHAFASSDYAHDFSELIRRHWPDRHRVSRFDSALDFDGGPDTWPTILELCKGIADAREFPGDNRRRKSKIRTNYMGDWFHGNDGRTFGLGSFKSAVYVRCYEKGIQVRQDAEKRGLPVPEGFTEHAVRLEVQVRPAGQSKSTAARSSTFDAWGYADWSRELLRRVNGIDVPRVHIKERRLADHDRAMQWMVKQYGAHLLEDVARLGSWEALGADLRRRLEVGYDFDTDNTEGPF